MKIYKRGISLIVLVITILVLAILATTVIVSLSGENNIIDNAQDAVNKNNLQSYQEHAALAFASWKMDNTTETLTDINELKDYGFDSDSLPDNYVAYVDDGIVKVVEVNVWDGTIASGYAGGNGTESNPYQINTGSQLAYLAKQVNDGVSVSGQYFVLTANIDLNNIQWTPIGGTKKFIDATFDGNNYMLFNLNVESSQYGGLFGYIIRGEIKNLVLCNGNVKASSYAGALIGYNFDGYVQNVRNIGVYVEGGTDHYRLTGYFELGWI